MKLTKTDFDVTTLEDELRVDGLCRELLMTFYNVLLESGMGEHDATHLANSADYFIRDYLIGARQLNILDIQPGEVRRFAGNWYIVNTLEPAIEEIQRHLAGAQAVFSFLHGIAAIDDGQLAAITAEAAETDFYVDRIEAFWNINGDGYFEWERACSLK